MRLRPRPTVKETLTNETTDDVPLRSAELPRKAQKLLGTSVQVNVSNSKDNNRDDFTSLRRAEQQNLGTRFAAAPQIPLPSGISDMPSWSIAAGSPPSSSELLPLTESLGQRANSSQNGSSTGVQTSQYYPNQQHSIESLNREYREYYDPSKQPLYVSQQTSASAVRDMALRKGSPKVHDITSNQMPSKLAKTASNAYSGDNSEKPKKLDLSSLFPRPDASSARLLSPQKYSTSPSAMTDKTEFFSQETMHAEIRRSGANGRFETHRSPKPPSIELANTPRVKIFEPDIYDNAKTHSRKPPKGIKNWFDGFDISSDEEENEPVELPANPPRPSVEGIPSDFSPYGVTAPERTPTNGTYPTRVMQGNLYPVDPSKPAMGRRLQSRSSESSTVTDASSGATGGQKRFGESRLAHSKLDSQSVLSLSSDSEDERDVLSPVRDNRIADEEGETLGPNLPSPVPRQLNESHGSLQRAGLRISESTVQTSGTIPVRLRDSTAAPMAVEDWAVFSDSKASSPEIPRSVPNEAEARETKSRTTTRSGQEREGLKSAGGETSSSVPSDASHVMAVTEEEMMLLELMRKKRAAMQNNSFREGYKLALKQEQDFLSKRRQSAHNSVSNMVDERAREEVRLASRVKSSVKPNETAVENTETHDRPPQNRYSVFQRIPGVEKGFNIDRFLAMEAPQEEPPLSPNAESVDEQQDEPERYVAKMARMERFLMMKPSLADAIYDGRPVSGTEIDTDTMTAATEDEHAPSPMARLAGMGREEQVVSPPMPSDGGDDELSEHPDSEFEVHHREVQAFLRSSQASANPSLTALPHIFPGEHSYVGGESMRLLSPSIPEDELGSPEAPDVDLRTPRPPFLDSGRQDPQPTSSSLNTPRPPFIEPKQALAPPTSKFQDRTGTTNAAESLPTELPTMLNRPSSVSTGFTSPLSQSFSNSTQPDNAATEASKSPVYPRSPYIASTARRINKLPTRIDTTGQKTVARITSMSSITSAGEDVLAAWAELGGGSDALAARRRGK